ncbi:MAG: ANTAR domain-containing protein [Butyrivibrio sp.]|nr:ANTAR domain-containing protein [Butyrivibrio sp.]
MPKNEGIRRSILIVSSSERFDALVKKSLAGFITIDVRRSASIARRCILERDYDLIVINAPMPDEMGVEFSLDAAEKTNSSILLVTPEDIYDDILEKVTDAGVLVISKPVPKGRMDKAIRYMISIQNRLRKLAIKNRSLEEKLEELRLVSRAKILLVEKRSMTEDEAHSYIGRQAMNNGVSRKHIAELLIEDLE